LKRALQLTVLDNLKHAVLSYAVLLTIYVLQNSWKKKFQKGKNNDTTLKVLNKKYELRNYKVITQSNLNKFFSKKRQNRG